MSQDRRLVLELIDEAMVAGARQRRCCDVIGLDVRTVQRWRRNDQDEDRRRGPKREPANKLSAAERERIREIANSVQYRDLSPKQIVPLLADQGRYVGSESSFYRVLRDNGEIGHRSAMRPASKRRPRALAADGPNQVWSWDITYLRTSIAGRFYYLYMMLDVWSRKIVGYEVHESESMELSAELIQSACRSEDVGRSILVLHADNGGPMKGATMVATLQQLGVTPSYSRPASSNDNAYSESLFRTLKYRPQYPHRPFQSLEEARAWVSEFVGWYNREHLHSGITYVTPHQRHEGNDEQILSDRRRVYEAARRRHPCRWTASTRKWGRVGRVWLNPEPDQQREGRAA